MQAMKEQLPVAIDLPGAQFRVAEWGDIAVAYVELNAGADARPLLEGLPNDRCACLHWAIF